MREFHSNGIGSLPVTILYLSMSLRPALSGVFVRVAGRQCLRGWLKTRTTSRLGTLDREADAEITAHVWVGSKARWDRLTWAVPSFERGIDSARLSES